MDRLTPLVQMLSFDPPPRSIPPRCRMQTFVFAIHGARSRAFRAKKVGSGGVWFIEPEADAREKKKERKRERGSALAVAKS